MSEAIDTMEPLAAQMEFILVVFAVAVVYGVIRWVTDNE